MIFNTEDSCCYIYVSRQSAQQHVSQGRWHEMFSALLLIKDKDQNSLFADGGASLVEVRIKKDLVTSVTFWLTVL